MLAGSGRARRDRRSRCAAAARAAGGEDETGLLREAVAALDVSEARARAGARLTRIWAPCCGVRAARWSRARRAAAARSTSRTGAARPALEDRALAELRATGARTAPPRCMFGAGALTRSERRIAELAASGRQNREIAETLVVTLATVEYHLRHAYQEARHVSST